MHFGERRNNDNFDTFGIPNQTLTSPKVFTYPEPLAVESIVNRGNGSNILKRKSNPGRAGGNSSLTTRKQQQ